MTCEEGSWEAIIAITYKAPSPRGPLDQQHACWSSVHLNTDTTLFSHPQFYPHNNSMEKASVRLDEDPPLTFHGGVGL